MIIHYSIFYDILIILGLSIINWIVDGIIIEEKQIYKKLIITIIGSIFILYMTIKLLISVSKIFPGGIN